jgi:hypothetical protein
MTYILLINELVKVVNEIYVKQIVYNITLYA